MRLLDLCEPFFQYVSRLNRSSRRGATFDATAVRGELKGLLQELRSHAAADAKLAGQFERVRLPLIFFADFMIKESQLGFAREWREIARDEDEHAGDEKFFDLLEETLAEKSDDANERLLIYYTCMGLGFTGFYTGQPEHLRKMMNEIAARTRDRMDLDETAQICPEAYRYTDTTNLIEAPGRKIAVIGLLLVGLVVVLLVTNAVLFNESRGQLGSALDAIVEASERSSAGTVGGVSPDRSTERGTNR